MKTKLLFYIAAFGILTGLISVYVYKINAKPIVPVSVSYNPYDSGIFANGIIESFQPHGSNINIYPEVSGIVSEIHVNDGQNVKKGDPLFSIDNSVQKQLTERDLAQSEAAKSLLEELKAQPRKENLEISKAQLELAKASLVNVQSQLDKIQNAYDINSTAITKDTLDNALNTVKVADQNVKVAQAQYDLLNAGAWIYDITNQENQYKALHNNYLSNKALLDKYIVRSPIDGVVLRIETTVGSYVSPQGGYQTYNQSFLPIVQMAVVEPYLAVRCFLNEILIYRLPPPSQMEATLFVRGENNLGIPLEFVRIQPCTIPNIELSNQKNERVDIRVLPIIFKFKKPNDANLFPGQLMDVYIKGKFK